MKARRKTGTETGTGTEKGFTLIEVLVAIAMISVGVLGLAANTISVTQGNRISASTTIAINLAQGKIEEIKAQSSFANETVTDSPRGAIFTRTWVISDSPEANLKQIEVTVSWTEYGVSRSVALNTYVYTG